VTGKKKPSPRFSLFRKKRGKILSIKNKPEREIHGEEIFNLTGCKEDFAFYFLWGKKEAGTKQIAGKKKGERKEK